MRATLHADIVGFGSGLTTPRVHTSVEAPRHQQREPLAESRTLRRFGESGLTQPEVLLLARWNDIAPDQFLEACR